MEAIGHEWSDKWLDLVVKVLATGASASQAAQALNNVFKTNVTRDAVLAKVRRERRANTGRFEPLPKPEKINGRPISFLLRSWENGISAIEIADYYGIHRNTVGRKAFEYGLEARDATYASKSLKIKRDAKKKANGVPTEKKAPFKTRTEFFGSHSIGLPLEDLGPRQCRFAVGDGPFLFCGAPTDPDKVTSYCPECHKMVYIPSLPR